MDTLTSGGVAVKVRRGGVRDNYRGIQFGGQGVWPKPLPALDPPEAISAAKRLWRAAVGRAWPGVWKIGRSTRPDRYGGATFTVNPVLGWEDMVHNLSHYAYYRLTGQVSRHIYVGKSRKRISVVSEAKAADYRTAARTTHSADHALIERAMIQMVIDRGWLDGKLKPPLKKDADIWLDGKLTSPPKEIKVKPTLRERNEARVDAGILRWKAKLKKAEAAHKRARTKLRELEAKKRRYQKIIEFKL